MIENNKIISYGNHGIFLEKKDAENTASNVTGNKILGKSEGIKISPGHVG